MLDTILYHIKKRIPKGVLKRLAPRYHYVMALLGALIYWFPSRKLTVIAVTGTKGKSSVTEILNAIFEEAGYTTAVSNTIRFKVGGESTDNLYKMSMPGRMFMQRFLRKAVKAGCTHAIIEATSQGAILYRHMFIDMDALIFTNLAPEHIEAHGSYEAYVDAKVSIARWLARSKKQRTYMVANAEDKESPKFLAVGVTDPIQYSIDEARPYEIKKQGFQFTYEGVVINSPLSGEFNLYNCLAAMKTARQFGVSVSTMKRALETFSGIRGRVERIDAGQDFTVVVDYAHTPDSLQKLYDVFQHSRRICVLGNTGGGRDTWKRDEMARIAGNECNEIILTNEDPYDDDPRTIVEEMAQAIPEAEPRIILDRREAIHTALSLAHTGDTVLITGKGTDPYIMGPNNTKTPWSDASVVREELEKLKARG